jgi:hypothetical protein
MLYCEKCNTIYFKYTIYAQASGTAEIKMSLVFDEKHHQIDHEKEDKIIDFCADNCYYDRYQCPKKHNIPHGRIDCEMFTTKETIQMIKLKNVKLGIKLNKLTAEQLLILKNIVGDQI